MSETGGKKNTTMIALAVVLAVAVILSLVLFNQSRNLSAQVDTLTEELTESRATWENTAAEKETIEAELKGAQDALREAETALEESTTKIGSLQTELDEANRVRTEAQTTLDTLSGQIESLTETLDYARSVLAGATEEPAEETEAPEAAETQAPEAAETEEPEDTDQPMPLIAPFASAVEAVENTETEEPAAEEATPTDIPVIPEGAAELEVVLDEETTLTLYVLIEDDQIAFIYGEGLDEAFLEQFIGKTLPVAVASDEEPEGIVPLEDDEATTQAVIDAVNSLVRDGETPDGEAGEEATA